MRDYTGFNADLPLPIPEACPQCGHSALVCEERLIGLYVGIGELEAEVEDLRQRCRPKPYAQQRSDLLDTISLAQAVLMDLKRAVEEVAL